MKILIVEDEEKLAEIILRSLRGEGFTVDVAATAEAGFDLATMDNFDLVILDLQLPDGTGTGLLQAACARAVTGAGPGADRAQRPGHKLENFQAGADDYVVKPCRHGRNSPSGCGAAAARTGGAGNVLHAADLEINRLTRPGPARRASRIELSPKEYSLLEYLFLHAGRVLSRTMIVEKMWDQSFEGLTNIVDVYVGHLRRKIDEGHEHKLIRTVRGLGYTLDPERAFLIKKESLLDP